MGYFRRKNKLCIKNIKNVKRDLVHDIKDIADYTNKHYSPVRRKLADKILQPTKPPINRQSTLQSISLNPTKENEITDIINLLKLKKKHQVLTI